jgi:hypothetical protein
VTPDDIRADRRRRGRLGVIEALATRGLPVTAAAEAISSVALSQGVSSDELLERIGAAVDPARFFEAMVCA